MKDSKISKEMTEESKFYFVHSYHMVSNDDNDVLFKTNYGYDFLVWKSMPGSPRDHRNSNV
jgi:imidazoleglycerol phosphate synthase glutamine amidotransferase subunit HisH